MASVVDGCPSTPGGCFDPGTVFDPDPRFDPRVPQDPRVRAGGGFQPFRPEDMGLEGNEDGMPLDHQDVDHDAGQMSQEPPEVELPPEGFFEYDDSWFDDE